HVPAEPEIAIGDGDRARIVVARDVADLARGRARLDRVADAGEARYGTEVALAGQHDEGPGRAAAHVEVDALLPGEDGAVPRRQRPWPATPDPVDAPRQLPLAGRGCDLPEPRRLGRVPARGPVRPARRAHRAPHPPGPAAARRASSRTRRSRPTSRRCCASTP